jgi:RNA polymerase sigma factor (sigma-70 family)
MGDDQTFHDLIRRVRARDEQAATDLVKRYERAILVAVRVRLGADLRGLLDSTDICQSVLASFFVRAASGQYELDQPANLRNLLVGIARKKLAFQIRKHRAQRCDPRRVAALTPDQQAPAGAHDNPLARAAGRDLLEQVRRLLTEEERRLIDLRAEGHGWAEIAAQLGGPAEGRRKQHARALDRVVGELGLAEWE